MSLTITQRPEAVISGETSRWNAVGNPIVYKMQRQDYAFDQINNASGPLQVQFSGVDISSEFTAGDVLYIRSDNGVYDLSSEIVTVAFSSPNTLLTMADGYSGAAPGGFLNNHTTRPGYNVEIRLSNIDFVFLNETPFLYSPSPRGELIINVSAIIRPYLTPDHTYSMTNDYAEDANAFISFNVRHKEVWVGSSESETIDGTVYYAVLGANQIPAPYGGNMAEYVTWLDHTPLGNWMTRLEKPVMWRGWPFFLSWTAGEIFDTDSYFLLLYTFLGVGAHTGGGDLRTSENTLWIDNIEKIFDEGTFDQDDKSFFAAIVHNDLPISESDLITEGIEIGVRDPCRNPIMLMGRNSLGGMLMWLFEWTQEYTFDYGNNRKAKRLTLYTDGLTLNQWEALQDFITLGQVYRNNILELTSTTNKTSTRVGQQVYVVEQDGTRTGVIVIPTKNQTKTRQYSHEFEIEIEFPEVFAV